MFMNCEVLMEYVRSKQTFTYRGGFPSLREIARQADIPPSTFTRLSQGKSMSAEALLSILVWLNKNGIPWGEMMNSITRRKRK